MKTPITMYTEDSNKRVVPYFAEVADGTEGLLAITQPTKGDPYQVTHIASGQSFTLGPIKLRKDARRYAKRIYAVYPRDRLRLRRADSVCHIYTRQDLMRWLGLVIA